MSRYQSYLNTAATILEQYNGGIPFAEFSKDFFSRDKKYGSTDRKQISHLCYCYFRLGKSFPDTPAPERILTALFLCSDQPNKSLEALKPEWNEMVGVSLDEKYAVLDPGSHREQYSSLHVFPWKQELSDGVESRPFEESFFVQPDLFLRLRPGKEKRVKDKLTDSGLSFRECAPDCLALPNASKVEGIVELNKEAIVQDYNSQRIGDFLQLRPPGAGPAGMLSVWDCCAASGGKSIMAVDKLGNIDLTVSDIRESIIANLKKRFQAAGIKNYKSYVADLSHARSAILSTAISTFDIILADVPCTGSGTWGRTPEQLYFFNEKKIDEYAEKQQKIVSNVIPALKPGAHLLYSTCSVFRKENEDRVESLQQKFGLQMVDQQLLKGYSKKADTLFAALLRKPAPIDNRQ
jgi:16S rRNA (cytosine967-C5)-methyltransferase